MLPLARTPTRAKSCAIIAALGEICGLADVQFSERWLREWVDPEVDTGTLCEQLTGAGLEVDGTADAASEFQGVVVGEVLEVARHPNADKLRVCTVADGLDSHQVVCGAPNARAGMKSAFARVGAALPDIEVHPRDIRGVGSRGMLCSAAELGLGDDADGILELPDAFATGTDLREALALDDRCITLDLTPNRGDCLSLKGVAREVGVLNDLPIRLPDCSPVPAQIEDRFPVEIVAGEGCPRYLGRVVRNVDTGKSTPLWMTERLRRSGLRSIDPVVDVTNYVMLELGQPLHAFDLDMLHERIIVRMAEQDERFTLLDGSQVELDDETLLIADVRGPVAMAGVMAASVRPCSSRAGTSFSSARSSLRLRSWARLAATACRPMPRRDSNAASTTRSKRPR